MAEAGLPADVVTRNLLEVSRLRDLRRAERPPADMTSLAVTARLHRVSELRDLCLALARGRPAGTLDWNRR